MSEESDLVTVHHASSPSEAQVVKGVLESAGIRALIPDANMPLPGIDLTPFDDDTGKAACEVMVPRADRERALQVLKEAHEAGESSTED